MFWALCLSSRGLSLSLQTDLLQRMRKELFPVSHFVPSACQRPPAALIHRVSQPGAAYLTKEGGRGVVGGWLKDGPGQGIAGALCAYLSGLCSPFSFSPPRLPFLLLLFLFGFPSLCGGGGAASLLGLKSRGRGQSVPWGRSPVFLPGPARLGEHGVPRPPASPSPAPPPPQVTVS